MRLNFCASPLTRSVQLDKTHIHLDTAISLLSDLYLASETSSHTAIFTNHLKNLYLAQDDAQSSSMIMLSSATDPKRYDCITGYVLDPATSVKTCSKCGGRANDWSKASPELEARRCGAFEVLIKTFRDNCLCGGKFNAN